MTSLFGHRFFSTPLWILLWPFLSCRGFDERELGYLRDDVILRTPPTYPPACSSESDEGCSSSPSCDCRWHVSESGARLAFLVTVHNKRTLQDAEFLFRAIRAPRSIIVIHIDKKLDWEVYLNSTLRQQILDCPCGTQIHVDSVYSCEWSSWSMNEPTHWGMGILVHQFWGQWDVFLNLSGDTMPVVSPQKLADLFHGPLRETNFVTSSSCETGLIPTNVYLFPSFWHKRRAYEGDLTLNYVDDDGNDQSMTLVPYFGSQWMALQPDFVRYLVTSLERPDSLASRLKAELIRRKLLMTDETFVPMILMHVHPFNETLPKINEETGSLEARPSMQAIRYERMDEHAPSAFGWLPWQQHYDVSEKSPADQPKVWGPYFLGVYDLANIKRSGALFVRKVSVYVDPNIVLMLPVENVDDLPSIQWPVYEVKLTEPPDWKKKKAEILAAKAEEEKKKLQQKEAADSEDSIRDEV